MTIIFKLAIALVVLGLIAMSMHIIEQYERGVVYRLGKVRAERLPGLRFTIPIIDRISKVMVAVVALQLEPQKVITQDSVSLSIRAVIYYKVIDAVKSEVEVDDSEEAIELRGQSVLRQVIGSRQLQEVLAHTAQVAASIKAELETSAAPWGLEVQHVELLDVALPKSLQRAMAAQAEATREAAAKVIAAKGEKDAAGQLAEAAALLNPTALRLRELQTMREIGTDNNTVIVLDSNSGPSGAFAGMAAAGQIAGQLSTD